MLVCNGWGGVGVDVQNGAECNSGKKGPDAVRCSRSSMSHCYLILMRSAPTHALMHLSPSHNLTLYTTCTHMHPPEVILN